MLYICYAYEESLLSVCYQMTSVDWFGSLFKNETAESFRV